MKKYAVAGLLAIFILAVLLRLAPLQKYDLWGVDTGEYYGITKTLSVHGHLDPSEYNGFGFTYPYFPGMYFVISSTSLVLPLDCLFIFSILIPVIGALSVILVYLISHSFFRNEKASLLASLFVGVVVIHVYQTSRTMPATLGHFLLLLCLLFLLKSYENRKFFALLVPATLALIFTHHLSAYFLLVASFGMVFFREIFRSKNDRACTASGGYLVFLVTIMMIYWLGYVTPFARDVIAPALKFPVVILPLLLLCATILLFLVIAVRRKSALMYHPVYHGFRWNAALFIPSAFIGIFILLFLTLYGVSGVPVIDKTAMLVYIPIAVLVGFVGTGITYADLNRNGNIIYGWIAGLGTSFIAATIVNSHEIFPDRHGEIIMVIIGIFIGYGIVKMLELCRYTTGIRSRAVACGVVFILLGVMIFTAYPPTGVLGGGEQGTYDADLQGIYWARDVISLRNDAIVASENRLSSDLYGLAELNATWYSAKDTFYSKDFKSAEREMLACRSPSGTKRVDYIMLDGAMTENAILVPWEPHDPISGDALAKFSSSEYIKLFDNGYCVIYMVNWGQD